MTMHAGELPVPVTVVQNLITAQFPQWRHLPVSRLASPGTVNAIFKVGDRLAARFPLRGTDPDAARRELAAEGAAARELAAATRFPVPAQLAIGQPGSGYPLPWSVQAWLPGRTGDEDDPARSVPFACDLAEFIAGVRAIGTRGRTFSGNGRGGDLKDHDDWVSTCLRRSAGFLDVRPLAALWEAFRELPRDGADVMSHGDLTPGNVLVDGGRLAGVLDVGSFGAADPALDLISAWNLLDARPRPVLRDALECTDVQWERGKAWAFQQAVGLGWYYAESNPVMSRLGRKTLDRILSAGRPLPTRRPLPQPLSAAVATARRDPPPLYRGDLLTDLPGLVSPALRGTTVVVYHSAVLAYVRRADRAAFAATVSQLGVTWLSNEGPGVLPGTGVRGCGPHGFVLARDAGPVAITGSHGTWVEWLP